MALPLLSNALTFQDFQTQSDIKHKVVYYALVKGVDPDLALFVADKESGINPKEIGDTDITCPKTGKAIYARGLFQITRCYHPEISDKDAFDENFSILFSIPLMKNIKTCQREWTTCKLYKPKVLPDYVFNS